MTAETTPVTELLESAERPKLTVAPERRIYTHAEVDQVLAATWGRGGLCSGSPASSAAAESELFGSGARISS
jgi:hypothetical protein